MRRLALIFGALAIVLITIVLSAPWWLGPALIRFGPKFGVTVSHYERVGYSRFAVQGVEYRRAAVVVKVQQAEADTPLVWLWRRGTSRPGPVKGGEWSVEVSSSKTPTTAATGPRGWVPLQRQLEKIADGLASWVPEVEAGKGVVKWPQGGLTLASATWRDRTVSSPDLGYKSLHGSVSGTFPKTGGIEVRVATLDGSAKVSVRNEGTTARGSGSWWDQPAELTAEFNEQGWLPREGLDQGRRVGIFRGSSEVGKALHARSRKRNG